MTRRRSFNAPGPLGMLADREAWRIGVMITIRAATSLPFNDGSYIGFDAFRMPAREGSCWHLIPELRALIDARAKK